MACNLTTGEVEYIDKTIADLKAENAKLVMKLNAEHLVRQNVERENAKLRELVRELRKLVRAMWLYDYAGKFSSAPDDVEHVAMVYQSMRKLGVEL